MRFVRRQKNLNSHFGKEIHDLENRLEHVERDVQALKVTTRKLEGMMIKQFFSGIGMYLIAFCPYSLESNKCIRHVNNDAIP